MLLGLYSPGPSYSMLKGRSSAAGGGRANNENCATQMSAWHLCNIEHSGSGVVLLLSAASCNGCVARMPLFCSLRTFFHQPYVAVWDRLTLQCTEQDFLACIPTLFKGTRVHVNGAICCWCVVAARDWLEPIDVKQAQATCWAAALETCHSALGLHILLNQLDHLEVAESIALSKVNRLTFLLDATDPEDDGYYTFLSVWQWYWQRRAVDLDHDQDQPAATAKQLARRAARRWQEFVAAGWAGTSLLPGYCLGTDTAAASASGTPSGFGLGIGDIAGGHWGDVYGELETMYAIQGEHRKWESQTNADGSNLAETTKASPDLAGHAALGTAYADTDQADHPYTKETGERVPVNPKETQEESGAEGEARPRDANPNDVAVTATTYNAETEISPFGAGRG